jgi:hypothetical protein
MEHLKKLQLYLSCYSRHPQQSSPQSSMFIFSTKDLVKYLFSNLQFKLQMHLSLELVKNPEYI